MDIFNAAWLFIKTAFFVFLYYLGVIFAVIAFRWFLLWAIQFWAIIVGFVLSVAFWDWGHDNWAVIVGGTCLFVQHHWGGFLTERAPNFEEEFFPFLFLDHLARWMVSLFTLATDAPDVVSWQEFADAYKARKAKAGTQQQSASGASSGGAGGYSNFDDAWARANAQREKEAADARAAHARQSSRMTLEEAYAYFGLNRNCTEAELNAAHRRKMQQNHPDNFASADPELKRRADELAARINDARDQIAEDRGFKRRAR